MTIPASIDITIQTMQVRNGHELKELVPDKDGIYRRVPIMVLGVPSRNCAMYDTESTVRAITDPRTKFAINLKEGNLEGEWFHPEIPEGISENDMIRTIMNIRRNLVSHYFVAVHIKRTDKGYVIIYADIIPFGPYGEYLKASFADPKRNTSFSLRALTRKIGVNPDTGAVIRNVIAAATFDAVDGPGFELASKRYAGVAEVVTEGSTETIKFEMSDTLLGSVSTSSVIDRQNRECLFSTENITDDQVLELLGSNHVTIVNAVVGRYDQTIRAIVPQSGISVSPFGAMYGRLR